MPKLITFKDWKELQSYMDEFVAMIWDAMEENGYTYEDGFNYALRLLRDKVKEDFGDDVRRTA